MKSYEDKKDYLDIVYDENIRPFISYPNKFLKNLYDKFNLKTNDKILDIDCGRGECLIGFHKCRMNVYGIDQSNISIKYYPEINFKFKIEN